MGFYLTPSLACLTRTHISCHWGVQKLDWWCPNQDPSRSRGVLIYLSSSILNYSRFGEWIEPLKLQVNDHPVLHGKCTSIFDTHYCNDCDYYLSYTPFQCGPLPVMRGFLCPQWTAREYSQQARVNLVGVETAPKWANAVTLKSGGCRQH
ncbi:hypothetical protein THAOC_26297 [Thalassiosira oceanica]|uniref:Uncharacterized protein n=1 Tax=Thalassiosira oceanica TaxID=159749 RepID=K0RZC7_THAOC|nr:hypothetical protein THAOC_26297 [Thalassiosira oceanica]|eukprot:EJK54141.1 hypothetical protein THAOC_26297 [Thalassiosira oceanica]